MSPTLAIDPKQPTRTGCALLLTSVAFFMVTLDSLVVVAGLALFSLASAASALAPSTTLRMAAQACKGSGQRSRRLSASRSSPRPSAPNAAGA